MYCGSTPKREAMYGTSGIRMPKPSVSMTQKTNSAASCRRIGACAAQGAERSVTRHERRNATGRRGR